MNQLDLLRMMKLGNPQTIYDRLLQTNPQFKKFVEDNKDKTPEQIAQENGVDINMLQQLINKF